MRHPQFTRDTYLSFSNRRKKWTAEEEDYLRQSHGVTPRKEIVEHLGRSWNAVCMRVFLLHLPPVKHSKTIALSPVDASWLAAAIDGEGCLYLEKIERCQSRTYRSVILISNTNLDFVQHAMDLIGAGYIDHISARPSRTSNGFCQPLYTYHLQGRVVVGAVMKAILPYVIIKKDRAELMIQASEIGDSRFASRREKANWDWARLEDLWNSYKQIGKGRGRIKSNRLDVARWMLCY